MFCVLILLVGVIFVQNIIFSKKIAALYTEMTNIEFYLRDGVCE